MQKLIKFIQQNIFLMALLAFSILILFINIKINSFRYTNLDYGKFDLGNMSQMLWNTLHGRFMYLTDYFGTNLPRWAMSHVDPILLLFLPIFIIFQHPMSLVYSQIILIIFSSYLIYKIAYLELKSKFAASIFGISFLSYPAIGFILAITGFHGVSAAIPFFLGAFYVFEKAYKEKNFTKKNIVLFWILLVITMSGKEQLPLYIVFYGIFILLFRNDYFKTKDTKLKKINLKNLKPIFQTLTGKLALSMILVGSLWFYLAFFVIIPANAHFRTEGYTEFAKSLNLGEGETRDVALPNYFLSRYDAFGESYVEIAMNMALKPSLATKVFFGGDKLDNLNKTFGPLAYMPLVYPPLLAIALPDLAINYLTSAGGIGTAEISNHRISMIIPVLFLASIYAISFLSLWLNSVFKKLNTKIFIISLSLIILGSNIYMSYYSNNPVFMWLTQAVVKRVFAKTDTEILKEKLNVGDVVKLSPLESKDRECAQKIINIIPKEASVSGPDYLGAHLSMRETYAIFPALYNKADYVIVDVFSKKILNILDVDLNLINDVMEKIIKDENYKLVTGCGNLFVFKNVGPHNVQTLLPLQERYKYDEKVNLEFFQSLYVVDYSVPLEFTKGNDHNLMFTYIKREGEGSLDDFVMFLTFINKNTGEMYQTVNLPSFGIKQPQDWKKNRYYTENVDSVLPEFLDSGNYLLFLGMDNEVRTRSMYLGEVKIK